MVPDGKVHGANMGSIWGRQDPGGSHVGPMNFAILGYLESSYPWKFYVIASCESHPQLVKTTLQSPAPYPLAPLPPTVAYVRR